MASRRYINLHNYIGTVCKTDYMASNVVSWLNPSTYFYRYSYVVLAGSYLGILSWGRGSSGKGEDHN